MEVIFNILIVLIIAGLLSFFVVQSMRQKQSRERKQEKIKKMADSQDGVFRKLFVEGNTPDLQALLDKDFSLFMHGNPYRIDGGSEAMKYYDQAMTETTAINPHNKRVVFLNENAILITYTFSSKGVRADKPFEGTGKTTHIWIKKGPVGEWKLVHDHTSYNS